MVENEGAGAGEHGTGKSGAKTSGSPLNRDGSEAARRPQGSVGPCRGRATGAGGACYQYRFGQQRRPPRPR